MAKIFIVHQYPDQIDTITRQLKADGYQVVVHFRGLGVSSAIAKELPDLIVLDFDRAFLDCKALCALLRQDTRVDPVPVILLSSAFSEAELQRKAAEAEAQGGIVGTAPPEQVVGQIGNYLRRKRFLLPSNEAKRLQAKAENANHLRAAIQAFRELVRLVELKAKILGEIHENEINFNVHLDDATAERMAKTYLARRSKPALTVHASPGLGILNPVPVESPREE